MFLGSCGGLIMSASIETAKIAEMIRDIAEEICAGDVRDDVIQQVVFNVLSNPSKFEAVSDLRPYLARCVRNAGIDIRRRAERMPISWNDIREIEPVARMENVHPKDELENMISEARSENENEAYLIALECAVEAHGDGVMAARLFNEKTSVPLNKYQDYKNRGIRLLRKRYLKRAAS
jgi:hypothetical protein